MVSKRGRRSIRYDAHVEPPRERTHAPDRPPEILLRRVCFEDALQRLEFQLRAFLRQGRREVVVVHGKGQNSPGGQGVLGPAVRQWCDHHGEIVSSWHEAPLKWGGSGAIVVQLNV